MKDVIPTLPTDLFELFDLFLCHGHTGELTLPAILHSQTIRELLAENYTETIVGENSWYEKDYTVSIKNKAYDAAVQRCFVNNTEVWGKVTFEAPGPRVTPLVKHYLKKGENKNIAIYKGLDCDNGALIFEDIVCVDFWLPEDRRNFVIGSISNSVNPTKYPSMLNWVKKEIVFRRVEPRTAETNRKPITRLEKSWTSLMNTVS